MSKAQVTVHDVHHLRVVAHDYSNANSITLEMVDSGGNTLMELRLFGMDTEETRKLLVGFGDMHTKDLSTLVMLDSGQHGNAAAHTTTLRDLKREIHERSGMVGGKTVRDGI